MDTLAQLHQVREELRQDPSKRNRDARRRFWRLVGRIKRMEHPALELLQEAAEIRDLLYRHSLGRAIALRWLALWFLFGAAVIVYYLILVTAPGRITGKFAHDWDVGAVAAAAVFFLYPVGRLLAGRWFGIRFDGITRDIYWLPTLKMNYRSYLAARPPNRMWFFFWSGAWTSILLLGVGCCGYLIAGEWTAIAYGIALALGETCGAVFGTYWGGELGHFRRERFIVRDWRKSRAAD